MNERKPIRHVEGRGWEVLDDAPTAWIACSSFEDAELIAEYESLCAKVFDGRARGEEVGSRLDAMADAIVRNIGHGTAERYVRYATIRARG